MTRENRNLLINALIFILLSITMVLGYDALTNRTPINGDDELSELFGEEVTLADAETITNDNVKSRRNVLNKDGEVVGAVYELETGEVVYFGDSAGNVEITLTINKNKEILAYEFGDYGHTEGFKVNVETMLNGMITSKAKLDQIELSLANGTGSTNSNTAVLELFIKLNDFLDGVEPEPSKYDEIFGQKTKLGTLTNINVENLISEQEILDNDNNLLGTSYILETGDVVYFGSNVGNVKFEIVVDNDSLILAYEFIDYGHTGDYRENVEELLNQIISDEVSLDAIDVNLADETGSTNTNTALLNVLIKLKDYLDGNVVVPTKYDLLFDTKTELAELEQFTNDNVLSKQDIKNSEGDVIGYSYVLLTDGINYVGGGAGEGTVKIELIIDLDEVILGYEFLEYNHTGGNYRANVEALLNQIISDKVSLEEIDVSLADETGSTNTNKSILGVLIKLKDFITGEPSKYDVMFETATTMGSLENILIPNLLTKQSVLDSEGNVIGYSYILDTGDVIYFGSNTGNVKFELIINNDEKILGYEFLEYNHTGDFQNNVIVLLDSIVADELTLTDINVDLGNSTGSTNSSKAILNVIIKVKQYLDGEITPSKYNLLFEQLTTLSDEETFENPNVLSRQLVLDENSNLLATSYIIITDSVVYYGANQGTIKLEVILNGYNEIISYDFVDYGHTTNPNWQNNVITLLNQLVTDKLSLHELNVDLANSTGSTNSNTAIIDALTLLDQFIHQERLDELFEEALTLGALETLSLENVLSKQTISVADSVIATSYILITDEIAYRDGRDSKGTVTIEVILNNDNEIIGYHFMKYGHSSGRWQTNVITFLDDLVTNEVSVTTIDLAMTENTSSTNTIVAIVNVIIALSNILEGGE